MPDNPLVYVIILNYKGKEDTLECVESVLGSDYTNMRTLVVDNASGDGSPDAVRDRFPGVEIIANKSNLMYAGGNNVGIKHALEMGAEYILLLNNDTIVEPAMVSRLVEAMEENPGAGLSCPMIYYHAQRSCGGELVWYAGGIVKMWTGLIAHRGIRDRDDGRYKETEDTGYITGCAMMMRLACIERVGLLDESFGMYSEDVDYSLLARASGFRLLFVPGARMWHKVSASIGGEFVLAKLRRKLRNNLKIFSRHATPLQWVTISVVYPARVLWNILTRLVLKRRVWED